MLLSASSRCAPCECPSEQDVGTPIDPDCLLDDEDHFDEGLLKVTMTSTGSEAPPRTREMLHRTRKVLPLLESRRAGACTDRDADGLLLDVDGGTNGMTERDPRARD